MRAERLAQRARVEAGHGHGAREEVELLGAREVAERAEHARVARAAVLRLRGPVGEAEGVQGDLVVQEERGLVLGLGLGLP